MTNRLLVSKCLTLRGLDNLNPLPEGHQTLIGEWLRRSQLLCLLHRQCQTLNR